MVVQEAHYFGLDSEPARSKAFRCLLNHGSDRLITDKDHPFSRLSDVFKPDTGIEGPVAIQDASAHTAFCLLGVLLTLMLRDTHQDVLIENRVSIISGFDAWALQEPSRFTELFTQKPMPTNVASETTNVIDGC
jgi:hypothetical protein